MTIRRRTQFDSESTVFFDRQLDYLMTKVFEKKYPELKGSNGMLFPVTSEAGAGAETITYRMYDSVGIAKIISNYADDLPMADVMGKEETIRIRSLGQAFQYSIQEVANSMMAGVNLPSLKAVSARTGIETLANQLAWYGDDDYGIVGIFNNPNFTVTVNTGKKLTDPTITADEMYDLVAKSINDQIELTNGVEIPDTVVMPIRHYSILTSKTFGANADHTVMKKLKENFPMITLWDWAQELKNVSPRPSGGVGTTNCMLTYKRDSEKIRLEIPSDIEQLAPQYKNLAVITNLHSRFAGIISVYPLSMTITEEI